MPDQIIAKYLSDYDSEKRDGSGRVLCPFCREAAMERDVEQYSEEGTSRVAEMCTNCREGFERDFGIEFEIRHDGAERLRFLGNHSVLRPQGSGYANGG